MVRYFIPVEDDDGVGCLLDLVTGNYFYNQGTGTFTKGPRIPQYTEIEYLESTGTQYIDTGINADNSLKLEMDARWISSSKPFDYTNVMGAIYQNTGSTTYKRLHMSPQNANEFFIAINTTNNTLFSTNPVTDRFQCLIDMPNKTATSIINGNTYNKTLSFSNFDTGLNFWLFKRNSNIEGLKYTACCRIYSFKMYSNNELVRDFIPVLDKDDVPCLYDKVNDTYYYNQGTGDFIGGDIMPRAFADTTGLQQIASNIRTALSGKQNNLTPGANITITNDTVAVDGTAITTQQIESLFT